MLIKKLNARSLLAFAILAVAGALALMVFRNFQGAGPEEIFDSLPGNVDLSLKRVHYTETREGISRWALEADSAAHSVGEGTTRIENIRMTFYDQGELGDVTLTARSGEMKVDTREVEVRGDVVVKSPRGYVFYTEYLRYREADKIIRTEHPVRFVSENIEVAGKGMQFNVQNHTFVLLSDVKAWIEGNR
jgi:LPS export ABC transporter protein LptC